MSHTKYVHVMETRIHIELGVEVQFISFVRQDQALEAAARGCGGSLLCYAMPRRKHAIHMFVTIHLTYALYGRSITHACERVSKSRALRSAAEDVKLNLAIDFIAKLCTHPKNLVDANFSFSFFAGTCINTKTKCIHDPNRSHLDVIPFAYCSAYECAAFDSLSSKYRSFLHTCSDS